VCGSVLCLGALITAFVYLGLALFTDIHFVAPGFSTLVIVLLFSNGLIFLYLGILGEYIGQTFLEVKNRPSFIVERTVNIKEAERTDGRD
jgi:dolichol-phosphate mannosyltransferase